MGDTPDQDEQKKLLAIAPPFPAAQAQTAPTVAAPNSPFAASMGAPQAATSQLPAIAPPGASSAPSVAPPAARTPIAPPTPVQSGGAKLWQAAGNIQNPVLRPLARIGAGIARAGDIGLEALSPRTAALVPGSETNTKEQNAENEAKFEKRTAEGVEQEKADTGKSTAATDQVRAQLESDKQKLAAGGEWKPIEGTNTEVNTVTGDNRQIQNIQPVKPPTEAETPLTPDQIKSNNAQLAARFHALNPTAPIPQEFQLSPGAKTSDFNRTSESLKAMESTAGTAAQREFTNTLAKGKDSDAKASQNDKSYQFNSTQLEKIRTPIDQLAGRMSTLTQNSNFRTPQADSLLAPEILSVVAGGQGSGLRMNQAELERIAGGATKWTELQTALNKWSTDPAHPTFTEEQRGQMRQIVGAIQAKVTAKQSILEESEGNLIDADDKTEQRQIVADTRKLLDAVDGGKKIVRKDGKIQIGQ